MITHFDDFCLWTYVVVDEIWQKLAPLFAHPGPKSLCSDSELLTLALVGECRGWDKETDMLHEWQASRHLFPHLPERSRFNRRRRNLCLAFSLIRQALLHLLDIAADRQCLLDNLPVRVMGFRLAPQAGSEAYCYLLFHMRERLYQRSRCDRQICYEPVHFSPGSEDGLVGENDLNECFGCHICVGSGVAR